jgi:hypothetical protein
LKVTSAAVTLNTLPTSFVLDNEAVDRLRVLIVAEPPLAGADLEAGGDAPRPQPIRR